MSCLLQYIRLEYKKTAKSFLRILSSLLLAVVLIFAATAGAGYLLYHAGIFEPVRISFVIPDNESVTKAAVNMVGMMDSVKSICRFEYDTEEEARKKVREDRVQAAVILPEDFYNDVNYGKNTPVRIVFGKSITLNTAVFKELVNDGTSYIGITESAIYAVTDTSREYAMSLSVGDMENLLTDVFLQTVFQRGSSFNKTVLSPTGRFDIRQYYTAVVFAAVLLFAGLNFGFLYRRREKAVEEKLKICGVGPVKTGLVRILVMTSVLFGLSVVLYAAGSAAAEKFLKTGIGFAPRNIIRLLPAAFSMAAFFHLIYSLCKSEMHAGMVLLMTDLIMLLAGGCILPVVYLPEFFQKAGQWLPLTFWRTYFTGVFFGDPATGTALKMVLAAGVVFAAAGEVCACRNS